MTASKLYPQFHRGREGLPYYAHPDLVTAFEVALALGRPLLLTGEPGCGKTDFVWAAADAIRERKGLRPLAVDAEPVDPRHRRVHECYVHSNARARDLLYTYDGLRRLADVQIGAAKPEAMARAQRPAEYIHLQPLGLAMLLAAESESSVCPVVLLDEIDKAPRDFPNDLLREFDRGGFEIAELTDIDMKGENRQGFKLGPRMATGPGGGRSPPRPFVVITSNVERDLPDPFLRRCIFYHVEFPNLLTLNRIIEDHFDHLRVAKKFAGALPTESQRAAITSVFVALRAVPKLKKKPATSELIDWAEALVRAPLGDALARVLSLAARAPEAILWPTVPAISCLIKLRDDRIQLGLSARE